MDAERKADSLGSWRLAIEEQRKQLLKTKRVVCAERKHDGEFVIRERIGGMVVTEIVLSREEMRALGFCCQILTAERNGPDSF